MERRNSNQRNAIRWIGHILIGGILISGMLFGGLVKYQSAECYSVELSNTNRRNTIRRNAIRWKAIRRNDWIKGAFNFQMNRLMKINGWFTKQLFQVKTVNAGRVNVIEEEPLDSSDKHFSQLPARHAVRSESTQSDDGTQRRQYGTGGRLVFSSWRLDTVAND